MLGAAALDMSPLKARTMLNMDSEDEGYLLVSCAGGLTAKAHLPVKRDSVTDVSQMQILCWEEHCMSLHRIVNIRSCR